MRDDGSAAREGRLETPHGAVETPAFMPVGTQATVKGLTPDQLRAAGTQMVLANTYHLALRPGEETVARLGGLHRFMGWDGPILTDSGGFQVFSLASGPRSPTRRGLPLPHRRPASGADARARVAIQEALGADVAMCLDHCPAFPPRDAIGRAVDRTIAWAARCKDAHARPDQALFGIVQGGVRGPPGPCRRGPARNGLRRVRRRGRERRGKPRGSPPGLEVTTHRLPEDRPRYLMGVGRPQDLLDAVATGIDLFDCVMPTRNGRNATCFTAKGLVKMRNAAHRTDRPIEEGCDCLACRKFSRATCGICSCRRRCWGRFWRRFTIWRTSTGSLVRFVKRSRPAGLSSCVWKCLKL